MFTMIDHLGAVLVGTVALVTILSLSHRARESAVETTVGNVAQARAHAFMRVLERDVENMRTEAETRAAVGTYSCGLTRDAGGSVESFTVPTLLDPDRGAASPVGHVTYRREPTGDSVHVDGSPRALYSMVREEDAGAGPIPGGGSGGVIVGIDVGFFALRSVGSTPICPDDLSRVRLEFVTAIPGPEHHNDGSAALGSYNVARHGYTVRPPGRGG